MVDILVLEAEQLSYSVGRFASDIFDGEYFNIRFVDKVSLFGTSGNKRSAHVNAAYDFLNKFLG